MRVRIPKTMKCECGKTVADGSVFCPHCRAEIKRENAKILCREMKSFNRKYLIHA